MVWGPEPWIFCRGIGMEGRRWRVHGSPAHSSGWLRVYGRQARVGGSRIECPSPGPGVVGSWDGDRGFQVGGELESGIACEERRA
eukprot:424664-Rhodomonas_salina.1